MEPDDCRVAAALSGSVLRASGADLVLAEWRDPGGGTDPPTYRYVLEGALRFHHLARRDEQSLRNVFEDHDSELLVWP